MGQIGRIRNSIEEVCAGYDSCGLLYLNCGANIQQDMLFAIPKAFEMN